MYFYFKYNKKLINEIKECFEGRRYHGFEDPPRKVWSAPITQRNVFLLKFLQGNDPYAKYDAEPCYDLLNLNTRPLYDHQRDMVAHGLAVKHFIWAAEMGTGKTLAAIVLMELSGLKDFFWVGPKSALRAVKAEMIKWNCRVIPEFFTYEKLKRVIENWPSGQIAPQGVIFDESVKIKTPTAKRSVAAKHLADSIREEHGNASIIGLLSGAPAPKSPADWWHQCEVACPGFIREGNIHSFRERLGVFNKEESDVGTYKKLETWLDDDSKCRVCGKLEREHVPRFTEDGVFESADHEFEQSENEVAKLYRRMSGLVLVKLKKDCLDLPEKFYIETVLQPTEEILRVAKIITVKATRAIEALTLLRELSDGFQYRDVAVGKETCPLCGGSKKYIEYYDPEGLPGEPDAIEKGVRFLYDEDGNKIGEEPIVYEKQIVDCINCHGTGQSDKIERTVIEVPCPKDEALLEELDLHLDIGRLNIYAGFTASVDKCIKLVTSQKWGYIRADGRGWIGFDADGRPLPKDRLLEVYQSGDGRIAFIGQAGAAGMGLTLTASPTTLFYSNTFNGDDRIQAEDRGHRIGMHEKGGRIVDFIHLETDKLVLDNLKKKKKLQHLSMTGIQGALNV